MEAEQDRTHHLNISAPGIYDVTKLLSTSMRIDQDLQNRSMYGDGRGQAELYELLTNEGIDKKAFLSNIMVTMILGLAFVLGVVGGEWQLAKIEGVIANKDVAGGIFYMMTGMHAFHVFTGLIFLFFTWRNGKKDYFTAENHWGVEAAAVYWHFVDVVWIFFYPALYLIGVAAG